jgi:hypothetical protein
MNATKCKHFNGVQNDACRAGVKYADVRIANSAQGGYSLPCLTEYNLAGATCGQCQLPTPDEIAAWKRDMAERFEKVVKARAAIVAHLGGPWKKGTPGSTGTIDCPVCGKAGGLGFSRSGYNGHIHAACKTPVCVQWME